MTETRNLEFGILTVSDRCFRGEAVDTSGTELSNFIETIHQAGLVSVRNCVPDEADAIEAALREWSDSDLLDVILTTGGTGFASRDVTPEATKAILDKEAPGLALTMITKSLEITKMAMLSRPVCGIRKNTLIINLPGSAKGSVENLGFIIDQLGHAVDLIRNRLSNIDSTHRQMTLSDTSCHGNPKSSVDPFNVASRDRKSRFDLIPVNKAQEIIMKFCDGRKCERISLKNALGRILAEDVHAKDPLPPFRASVKDGYAVKVSPEMKMSVMTVIGGSTAGDAPEDNMLSSDKCFRISTGAPLPDGADAVIQVEDTELVERTQDDREEKTIRLLSQPVLGQDIREIGADISENKLVLQKGLRLGPPELGILASVGAHKVSVFKKPVIAILSTGNELQDPMDETLLPGKIRDSNKTTLEALFVEEGYQTVDVGIARDSPDEVYGKLLEALDVADIVVSTGGVSMGERDFLMQVLVKDIKAEIHFGSVLMKPGKPTKFATCTFNGTQKLIFGLPGNPVSATVTALLFVIPACRKLSGWEKPIPPRIMAAAAETLKLDKSRPEYHRGHVLWNGNKDSPIPTVQSTGNQASSRLASCVTANALLCLPQGSEDLKEVNTGELVECILLTHL